MLTRTIKAPGIEVAEKQRRRPVQVIIAISSRGLRGSS